MAIDSTFKKSIFQYYSSATQSKTGSVGDESTADGRASILKSLGLWSSVAGAIVLVLLGVIGVSAFFTPEPVREPEPEPVVLVEPAALPPAAPEPVARVATALYDTSPSEPPLSTLWRVAGYIKGEAGEAQGVPRVALQSQTSGTRFIPLSDCSFYPSGIDVFCDVDGERITPWSGQGAISTVYQSRPAG